jgi:hypothetical protein
VKKGKMVQPQFILETNVESSTTHKKTKRVKKEKMEDEK